MNADCDPVEYTVFGLTTNANTISLVFLEAIRDYVAGGFGQPHVVDYSTGVAHTTVHEVGHQFFTGGLPDPDEHRDNPDNIMDTHPFTVAPGEYYFASQEVATLRMRVESP